ncbi:Uma2 family endonuclease [Actinoplanes sp. NPDC051859]|uniref:Uma2 family endonuclease n=1 Tax=Actinoplanes sp. NPDC051859 TaxID=3363909 RepID=UPI00379FF304
MSTLTLRGDGGGGAVVVIGHSSPVRWAAPEGPWTEPDLHLFPQDGHRYEIVDGSLHVTPPLDDAHETVVQALIATLRAAAPEGWWVCDRLGIALGTSSLIPDVTVLRPRSSGAIWADPADVALVIEVENASSRHYDRLLKPALYADAGIPGYWRITGEHEPELHMYELGSGGYLSAKTVQGADPVKVDAPFPVRVTPSSWV